MNTNSLDAIVNCIPPHGSDSDIQRGKQNITEGSKVLEIGCGQGDTTAALAYLVGDTGFVHGIDIASPNYRSPVTLRNSIDFKKLKIRKTYAC
ncbi:methyltransferase domain-containing protein [Psychrobacillus sp.]|uniref:methyltransferase domain-containing protein n=1 Tax=Psychrobacillus sp. TaxID=1871623 RepID=UPI0028BE447B|nr:methyltransferase domain-containing protein [Psychrobacillus sp.]